MKFFVLFSESKTYKRGKEVASKLETSIQNVVEGSYISAGATRTREEGIVTQGDLFELLSHEVYQFFNIGIYLAILFCNNAGSDF